MLNGIEHGDGFGIARARVHDTNERNDNVFFVSLVNNDVNELCMRLDGSSAMTFVSCASNAIQIYVSTRTFIAVHTY